MKYVITYINDKWNSDNRFCVVLCNTIGAVNDAMSSIKLGLYDDGEHQHKRNIKVYKAEEITDEFDTKTEYDDEKK